MFSEIYEVIKSSYDKPIMVREQLLESFLMLATKI